MMRILSTAYNSIIGEQYHHHHHHQHHNIIVSDIEEDAERQGEESLCDDLTTDLHNDDDIIMSRGTTASAQEGDIVTLELSLVPENGFVPEPLFETAGQVSFVLGWGNYLPGLHQLVLTCGREVNAVVENVSIDAGWGSRRADLLFTVSKENLQRQNVVPNVHEIQAGSWLQIPAAARNNGSSTSTSTSSKVQVLADQVTEDAIVLDANPPLAGSSYSCSFRVLSIDPLPSLDIKAQQQIVHDDDDAYQEKTILSKEKTTCTASKNHHPHHHVKNSDFQVATFALGCFWGAELAFSRQVGVVGTRVGYSQGVTKFPTYQQVCSGTTKHRESVMVIYNASQVSYTQLLQVACQRLIQTTTTSSSSSTASFIMFHEDDDDNSEYPSQYKPGFYYHTEEQYETARTFLQQRRRSSSRSSTTTAAIELLPACTFYNAEEYHQHYLFKGGQSARKGAKETIRCYG